MIRFLHGKGRFPTKYHDKIVSDWLGFDHGQRISFPRSALTNKKSYARLICL